MSQDAGLPVAVVKRDFRRLLQAAEQGQRTVILRHGRAVAELGPVRSDRTALPSPRRPGGLLALIGTFADWQTMDTDMGEIVAARRFAAERPPPTFD